MDKKRIIQDIIKSNLPEEYKKEVIQIIEQYDKDSAKDILPRLFKLIDIASTLIKLFCGD